MDRKRDLGTLLWLCILTLLFGACAAILTQTLANAQTLPARNASATIQWIAPTVNADGTPLTDLSKYRWSVAPNGIDLTAPGVVAVQEWTTDDAVCPGDPCEVPAQQLLEGLQPGVYRVWGQAIDTAGNVSAYSAPSAPFTFDGSVPAPPTNVEIQITVHVDVRVGG